jgi:outer membrane protein assembly factor BamB
MIFLVACSPAVYGQDAPTFRGNAQHTGVYSAAGITGFSGLKWKFHTNGMVIGSAAVSGESVYVGSTDGSMYAVDAESGKQKWKFDVKSRVVSSPAVSDGAVYFTAYDGNVYAVGTADGQLRWKFKTDGERRFAGKHLHGVQPTSETMPDPFDVYLSSPVVWNGAVFFGSGDGNIYSLNAQSGALNWKFKTGDIVHASPAIDGGTLFVGSWDSYFYALDATSGKERWRFKTGEDPEIYNQIGIQSSASVADGVVYFGCRDSHLYALDEKTGQKKWEYPTNGSWVVSSPAVKDGSVYFVTSDSSTLFALDAKSGTLQHSMKTNHWFMYSSPAIAGGMLYVGSTQGRLMAVDLASLTTKWNFETDGMKEFGPKYTKADGTPNTELIYRSDFYDDMVSGLNTMLSMGAIVSSPVVVNRTVFVGSTDGNLYALK